ncbi:GNAT family N-acetyltransferase [Brachybacterium conglomeratum]|uniref:GNAT family N-acetyltransferase n=1 Tax=Brachybacterium conglomeratum TaxID=47846 RepID=UPI003DA16C8B
MHVPDGAAVPSPDEERRAVGASGDGTRADEGDGSAGRPDGEILTERLRLTPVAEADEAELFALHSDPRAFVEDSTDPLTDPAQMRWVLAQWRQSWQRHGTGHLTVRAREGADLPVGLLGVVGLVPLSDGDGADGAVLSAYWRLSPEVIGRGVATEAMRAVLGALDADSAPEIVAITARGNAPSLALAARLGFVPAPPERPVPGGRDGDVLLLLPPSARGRAL